MSEEERWYDYPGWTFSVKKISEHQIGIRHKRFADFWVTISIDPISNKYKIKLSDDWKLPEGKKLKPLPENYRDRSELNHIMFEACGLLIERIEHDKRYRQRVEELDLFFTLLRP